MTLQEVIKRDLEGLQFPATAESPTPRVLIVEDNQVESQLLEAQLQSKGAKTEVATTTDDAIERIVKAIPFTAAVVDLSLPGGKSGILVAASLRNLWPQTRVAILSGFVDEDIRQVCEKHGFRVFQKPVDGKALSEILDLILKTSI